MHADAVLLLPGMMCDARLWSAQIESLDCPVHVADTTRHDNIANMASNILDAAPPRFAVAGLSMGGILAFEIWRQASERITHLALIDTNPHADSPERRSLRLQQIEDVLAGKLRAMAVESLKPVYLAEANRDDPQLLETILAMTMDLGPEVFQRQTLALRDRVDSVPTLATIDCPTTVMCGREDLLCPVEYHELMADRIAAARLVVIDQCGHLASLEQPDVVSAELQRLFDA